MTTTTDHRTTIVLTNRPPVRIDETAWPIVASASYTEHDGRHPTQANRQWRGALIVRQHADGRVLVYGTREFETNLPRERGYSRRAGELLPPQASADDLVATIRRVHAQLAPAAADAADRWADLAADRWADLTWQVIADLPPEEI